MRLLVVIAFATGLLSICATAAEPGEGDELKKLAGVWRVVSTGGHGKVVVAEGNKAEDGRPLWQETTFTIADGRLTTKVEPVVLPMARPEFGLYFAIHAGSEFRLKPGKVDAKGLAAIDVIVRKDVVLKGVYELKGDELKLCFANWLACEDRDDKRMAAAADDIARPTGFTTKVGGEHVSYLLRRVKK